MQVTPATIREPCSAACASWVSACSSPPWPIGPRRRRRPGAHGRAEADGRITVRALRAGAPLHIDGQLDEDIYRRHQPIGDLHPAGAGRRASRRPRRPRPGCSSTTIRSTCRRGAGNRIPSGGSPTRCGATPTSSARTTPSRCCSTRSTIAATAILFYANPIGGLADSQITDEGPPNVDWNTVWDVKTGRFDGGWTIEMAIPFKSLRYQPGRDQTWGINLRRVVRWKNEWSYLAQVPRAMTTFRGILKISSAATLAGLQAPVAAAAISSSNRMRSAGVYDRHTVTPRSATTRDGSRRRRRQVRRHAESHRRPDDQYGLRSGRSGRAAGQPDALQPVFPREA